MILLQAPGTGWNNSPASGAITSIEEAADALFDTMLPEFTSFVAIGQAIGLIGAFFYVFYRLWAHQARNEAIDIYPLLRPLVISMILLAYPGLYSGLAFLGRTLNDATQELGATRRNEVEQQVIINAKTRIQNMGNSNNPPPVAAAEDKRSWFQLVTDSVMGMANSVSSAAADAVNFVIDTTVNYVLMALFRLLYFIVIIGLKIISTYFLIILGIFGPLTIGLGCFDWFYSSIAAWVGRVLHTLLWIPIANIYGFILDSFHLSSLNVEFQQLQGNPGMPSSSVANLLFYAVGIFGYLLVPKLATWVLDSTGVSDGLRALSAPLRTAGAVAGAASGQVSGRVISAASSY
ncbi:conjugate transposon protein (plasmid) [Fibrisoma limi BUZ 3]|uniref:Conjugate transposon protein n=1 Tax=Fibrisoma limi BUZ 3 TaxID=1185876 RepID=I2GTZ8_9BACT|nr:transposase [Fibrisoma limi]CCH57599.1 conjugate transposon protein [Fibrisoma limi BUZ 3]